MSSVGVGAVVAVFVLGTVAGLWRRRTDGRFRDVGDPTAVPGRTAGSPSSGDVTGSSPGLASASSGVASDSAGPPAEASAQEIVPDVDEELGVIGAEPASGGRPDPSAGGARLDPALLAELGVEPARATLLQFSSAFCAPCRAVRRVSSEVAALVPGVRHVEVDAESHLDAVRALGIWRTPTLLILDADGRVAKRATGVPAKPQLIAVLGDIL